MEARPPDVPAPPADRALPAGFRIRLDARVRRWADGSVLVGGSPWRISRLKPPAQDLVRRHADARATGLVLQLPIDLTVARMLLDRGFANPLPNVTADECMTPAIVIPAMDHADNLDGVLASLGHQRAVVVDDGSRDPDAVSGVACSHGARLIRHDVNQGPAAARNTGLAAAHQDRASCGRIAW